LAQFEFAVRNAQTLIQRYDPKRLAGVMKETTAEDHMESALSDTRVAPTLSVYSPSTNIGAVSESFAKAVSEYIAANPQRLLYAKKKYRKHWPGFVPTDNLMSLLHFRSLMHIRYLRSLVEPGEAVGLLASQG
jgi:DNA-directed RNA polymerase I subunit RPA1